MEQGGPKSHMAGVLIKGMGFGCRYEYREIALGRLYHSYRPRNYQIQDRGLGPTFPSTLMTACSQTSSFRDCEAIHFYCLCHPMCRTLSWQPEKSNVGTHPEVGLLRQGKNLLNFGLVSFPTFLHILRSPKQCIRGPRAPLPTFG